MDKCECYHVEYGKTECWGTKECEVCNCEGDTNKCDFYPEKKEKSMSKKGIYTTADMWLRAQENGKMYCSEDMAYSKECGFVNLFDLKEIWSAGNFGTIDEIMNLEWKEVMTITKAEKMLGVRIIED